MHHIALAANLVVLSDPGTSRSGWVDQPNPFFLRLVASLLTTMEELPHQHPKISPSASAGKPRAVDALPQDTQKMIHTRSCNKREVCSCFLRLQSAYFQKNLGSKKKKKKTLLFEVQSEETAPTVVVVASEEIAASIGTKTRCRAAVAAIAAGESSTPTPQKKKKIANRRVQCQVVSNLQLFDIEVKQIVAGYLLPVEIARLSMVRSLLPQNSQRSMVKCSCVCVSIL